MSHVCPVCGWLGLGVPPWVSGLPSYVVCPCCATEFGVDDASVLEVGSEVYRDLRRAWCLRGSPWTGLDRPTGWTPDDQLRSLEQQLDRVEQWVEMAVFGRFPISDGTTRTGQQFGVRDLRPSWGATPHPEEDQETKSSLTEFVLASADDADGLVDQGFSRASPVLREPAMRHKTLFRGCGPAAETEAAVIRALQSEGVVLAETGDDLRELDRFLDAPLRGRRLARVGDPFGAEWVLGIGALVARLIEGRCELDPSDVRGELALEVVAGRGTTYPVQRLYKRLLSPRWSLYSYGVALGVVSPAAGEILLWR